MYNKFDNRIKGIQIKTMHAHSLGYSSYVISSYNRVVGGMLSGVYSRPVEGGNYVAASDVSEGGVTKASERAAAVVLEDDGIVWSTVKCSLRSDWEVRASAK